MYTKLPQIGKKRLTIPKKSRQGTRTDDRQKRKHTFFLNMNKFNLNQNIKIQIKIT